MGGRDYPRLAWPGGVTGLPPVIQRRRRLARLVLIWEALWPASWPVLALAGTLAAAALFGLPQRLPEWARLVLLLGCGLGCAALAIGAARRTRWPDAAMAERRLERDSGLRHQPFAVLRDRPATAQSADLWQAHQAGAARGLDRLRLNWPRPGLAARDRQGLRGLLLVVLAAGIGVAGWDSPARLAALFAVSPVSLLPALDYQGWISPPPYTGLPPIMLPQAGGPVQLPAGGLLHFGVTAQGAAPALRLDGRDLALQKLDRGSWQAEQVVTSADHDLVLRRWLWPLAHWQLGVVPDRPPAIAWAAAPGIGKDGSLRLPWQAEDDYGIASVQAVFRLRDRTSAAPFELALPAGGHGRSQHGIATPDLTAHPWAGLPVVVVLRAADGAGQKAETAAETLTLPERVFRHPLARALAAIRKQLSQHPEDRLPAEQRLAMLAATPQLYDGNSAVYLNLSAMISLLARSHAADAVDQAQDRMWQLALALEDGAAARTKQALEQALADARNAPDNALEQRIRDLQHAIDDHLRALAQQDRVQGQPPSRTVTRDDLQRMAERAAEAARRGDKAEAARDLAALDQILNHLHAAPGAPDPARQAARQRARQLQNAMRSLVQRQAGLLDRSESRASGQEEPDAAQPGDAPGRDSDAAAQQDLRRDLGGLMQKLGEQTGDVPGALGEAELAMRNAVRALQGGDDTGAGFAQKQSVEALQRGSQALQQQMARRDAQDSGDPNDGDPGDRGADRGEDRRDPLGRDTQEGTSGGENDSATLPATADAPARSRRIQQELRDRGADRTRPQPELDYIERLLNPF